VERETNGHLSGEAADLISAKGSGNPSVQRGDHDQWDGRDHQISQRRHRTERQSAVFV
jgi:hypothetical protein